MSDAATKAPAEKPAEAKKGKEPKDKEPAKEKAGKKGGFPIVLVLVPIALIAACVLAFTLPPTHALLMKSPLGPLLARFEHTAAKSAASATKPADPVADVKRLNDTVESDRKAAADKDAQIAQLQAQVSAKAAVPDASPTPVATPTPLVVTDEMKRAATYWAGMDADKAAEIVKVLPDDYVKAVFTAMPPDAVSDIMSELPAKTAARLTTTVVAPAPAATRSLR